jgi:hypothetical protein
VTSDRDVRMRCWHNIAAPNLMKNKQQLKDRCSCGVATRTSRWNAAGRKGKDHVSANLFQCAVN